MNGASVSYSLPIRYQRLDRASLKQCLLGTKGCHTYELTMSMVACIGLAQDQTNQNFTMHQKGDYET